MTEAELTSTKWHDFVHLQSGFAVGMKSVIVLGIIKVFFWTHENRCWPDAARSVKFMPFPLATSTFVFLVLEEIMKSKVFRGKTARLKEGRLTSMLKP